MLAIFGKKKLSTERTAHLFAHNIIETVESGFPDIAGFINDSPEFVTSPCILPEDYGRFLMIVVAGNYAYISQQFQDGEDKQIIAQCNEKLAPVFGMSTIAFADTIAEYKSYMSRVNTPSKNTVYAMSKAVFFKYNLNQHQDDYFKQMKTPNPIFLKSLDELMKNFVWDWEVFTEKYKVVA
ncbi:MAG: hypothetical protein ACKVOR_10900 [Flavobacteriales bacterium]